ncbi:DNA invertase Pin-like site-specific DNA recombinase [Sporomusaceae bacterium BoRhaA]|uniref:recombinase family protein n=1 Tax=Pelorhabdus rhamnosifermentans TaxID=2772457 RepID=UPI001FE7386E|nr:recombinase family protein [Pelorhabdus rhamnosifermentans]MBU2703466.1 DNA invertase Pin-like site-specific DNA recombinase [Pelorhabdus rhamnosifermentans]
MIAALYVRVSTDEQARTGYSLGDQIRRCRERFISMELKNIKEYIDDGYSGEFLERPALQRLRNDLANHSVSHVLVYDPDRLSRNLTNQLILADEIEKSGCQLLFVTGDYDASPEGRLFFSMRGAIAAFEKAKIRERTMRGKRAKALSGKPLFGRPPYGYSCDYETGQYIIIPEEANTIREIFHCYASNLYGVRTLAAYLEASHFFNRNGKPFSVSFLHRLLANELYAGTKWAMTTYQKTIAQHKRQTIKRDKSEWIAIPVPPIIDREIWHKTVELRKQKKILSQRNKKHEYLLSGIIKCADCGYAMQGVTFHSRNNKYYHYYVCTAYINRLICHNKKCIPVLELDDAVWKIILNICQTNPFIHKEKRKSNSPVIALKSQLFQYQKRQISILKWVASGTIPLNTAEKELKNLHKQIEKLQKLLTSATSLQAREASLSPEDFITPQTFEEKRQLLLKLNIVVHAKKEKDIISFTLNQTPIAKLCSYHSYDSST